MRHRPITLASYTWPSQNLPVIIQTQQGSLQQITAHRTGISPYLRWSPATVLKRKQLNQVTHQRRGMSKLPSLTYDLSRRSLLVAASAMATSACTDSDRETSYNYRLTVEAVVDGEIVAGASVIRVRWRDHKGRYGWQGGRFESTVWGSAVTIDLGKERGLFFATLSNQISDKFYTDATFPALTTEYLRVGGDGRWSALKQASLFPDEVEVPEDQWPLFVRFRDLSDPSSVEQVDPRGMSTQYGPGIYIRRVLMKRTEDPPTETIHDFLPWVRSLQTTLAGAKERKVRGPLAGQLGRFDFWKWGV